jgi:hypothetical protein
MCSRLCPRWAKTACCARSLLNGRLVDAAHGSEEQRRDFFHQRSHTAADQLLPFYGLGIRMVGLTSMSPAQLRFLPAAHAPNDLTWARYSHFENRVISAGRAKMALRMWDPFPKRPLASDPGIRPEDLPEHIQHRLHVEVDRKEAATSLVFPPASRPHETLAEQARSECRHAPVRQSRAIERGQSCSDSRAPREAR